MTLQSYEEPIIATVFAVPIYFIIFIAYWVIHSSNKKNIHTAATTTTNSDNYDDNFEEYNDEDEEYNEEEDDDDVDVLSTPKTVHFTEQNLYDENEPGTPLVKPVNILEQAHLRRSTRKRQVGSKLRSPYRKI